MQGCVEIKQKHLVGDFPVHRCFGFLQRCNGYSHRRVLPKVGEEAGFVLACSRAAHRFKNLAAKAIDSLAGGGGGANSHDVAIARDVLVASVKKIDLVFDHHELSSSEGFA